MKRYRNLIFLVILGLILAVICASFILAGDAFMALIGLTFFTGGGLAVHHEINRLEEQSDPPISFWDREAPAEGEEIEFFTFTDEMLAEPETSNS